MFPAIPMRRTSPLPRFPRRAGRPGFTLAELLVSLTILAVLVILATSITNSARQTISHGKKRMDSEAEARLVLDRLGMDLQRMIRRRDVDCLMLKHDGGAGVGANDFMAFYTALPGFSGDRRVSAVAYRVNAESRLERGCAGLSWTDGGSDVALAFLPKTIPDVSPSSGDAFNGSDGLAPSPDYQVLGDRVFRIEFYFLLKDGTLSPGYVFPSLQNRMDGEGPPSGGDDETAGFAAGSWWFDSTANQDYVCVAAAPQAATWKKACKFHQVTALVVAIGILDTGSRAILTPAGLNSIQQAFPDAVVNADIMASWNEVLSAPDALSAAGVPPEAASGIRVYQRYFFLEKSL